MNLLEGRQDGDVVWLCFPSVEVTPAGVTTVKVWINEATVFSAEHKLVQSMAGDKTPRGLYSWCESVHESPQAAWQAAASVMRKAAAELAAKASEFDVLAAKIAAGEEAA